MQLGRDSKFSKSACLHSIKGEKVTPTWTSSLTDGPGRECAPLTQALCHCAHMERGALLNKAKEQREKTEDSVANLCYVTCVLHSHLDHLS